LAALLHGTLVEGVSQTLQRRTEGTTYIQQGGHHVGHRPTFLVEYFLLLLNIDYKTDGSNNPDLPVFVLLQLT